MKTQLLPSLIASMALLSPAFAGVIESKAPPAVAISPTIDPWEITASLPLWVSGVDGTVGVLGYTAQTSADFADIVRNLDMVAAATLEIRKGRWGGWVDGAYLKASVGADTPGPLLNSLGVGIEQITIEAALFYRAWQSDRGFLDVYAGARYMSLGGELRFDVSDSGIRQVSEQLSAQVLERVLNEVRSQADAARRRAADVISTKVRDTVADTVAAKAEQVRTTLANLQQIAQAHPRLVEIIRNSDRLKVAIRDIAEARLEEKITDAQSKAAELQALGSAARSAVAAAKSKVKKALARAEKKLAREIEAAIRSAIPSEVSQTAEWVDPFIGLRGLYRFTDHFYAVAKADIGGFGVSSDLT
jgi:hypothetical protein